LDVVALRGHQLFAFSCGTAVDRKPLKLKLLEIYMRARQIGGEEARAALVCPTHEPTSLEEETRNELGLEGQVKVFGRQHWKDLTGNICEWVQEQSRRG
jgi:hypothetical protein